MSNYFTSESGAKYLLIFWCRVIAMFYRYEITVWIIFHIRLGHAVLTHSSSPTVNPGHKYGSFIEHTRSLLRVPVPQVTLHPDQAPQSPRKASASKEK